MSRADGPRAMLKRLSQREQLYSLAAGGALLLYALYALTWRPLAGMRDELAAANLRAEASMRRVRALSAELQSLQGAGATSGERNLGALVNTLASRHSLTPSRIQSAGGGATRIRFEGVAFERLTRLLHQIEVQEELRIRDIAISQGPGDGRVDASIRVGPGS